MVGGGSDTSTMAPATADGAAAPQSGEAAVSLLLSVTGSLKKKTFCFPNLSKNYILNLDRLILPDQPKLCSTRC